MAIAPSANRPAERMYYLDNIRIFLTILVIFHHTAIAYGGAGSWAISDPPTDAISPIVLTFFNAVNQSYFMSMFFFMAGYFTPRSLAAKGFRNFLKDRLIRLGIPILVYTTVIFNINAYIIDAVGNGAEFHWQWVYQAGHLWFLQALLLFALIYVTYRQVRGQSHAQTETVDDASGFPRDRALIISISVLAVLTFLVRTITPVGEWVLNFQFAHFVHYTFSFFVGVLAYRRGWLKNLPRAQARRWGIMALVVMLVFFPLLILGGALESEANVNKFLGGMHWQSFVYALWETILFIAISVSLLSFMRERFNKAGAREKWLAVNVFTVYIVHQTILYLVQVPFLSVEIPTPWKFLIVPLIAVPLCFLVSSLIRRIPYTKQILG